MTGFQEGTPSMGWELLLSRQVALALTGHAVMNCAQLSAESSKLPGTGKAPSSPLRCATQLLDSSPGSVVRGRFYVSESTPVLTGMSFKIARTGTPGDF
ncbi:MAG: hypothetical protein U0V70_13605 [Terriglobia bacterium]